MIYSIEILIANTIYVSGEHGGHSEQGNIFLVAFIGARLQQ